jgi:hypothetical protein
MKAIRLFLAFTLLMLAIPMWRFIDWAIIFWPHDYLYGGLLTLNLIFLVLIPLWLIFIKMPIPLLMFILGLCFIPFAFDPLSRMATTDAEFNHCGQGSFTGTFYPLKHLMPYVQEYDLEIRNQLCWIRKMIRRAPVKFDSQNELEFYSELLKKKLTTPSRKYKVSIIGIYFLWSTVAGAWRPDGTIDKIVSKKQFVDEMIDWYGMYDFEVGDIEFKWYDWPYSSLLKLEYGWVENNITLQSQP